MPLPPSFPPTDLVLVGAGQMARAMVQGWGPVSPFQTIYSVDPYQETGVGGNNTVHLSGPEHLPALTRPFILLFAVKPQILPGLLPLWKDIAPGATLVLSIAAGISCDTLAQGLGRPVIRLMPNTPVAVGSGIVGYYVPTEIRSEQKDLLHRLLIPLGLPIPVTTEDDLNRITAFSGSGPAYVYAFFEALEQAALSLNFPPDQAAQMVQTLVQGSLKLKEASPLTPAALRQAVTSKGGTTAAGLAVLMDALSGLSPLLTKTVQAAYERAGSLSKGE